MELAMSLDPCAKLMAQAEMTGRILNTCSVRG